MDKRKPGQKETEAQQQRHSLNLETKVKVIEAEGKSGTKLGGYMDASGASIRTIRKRRGKINKGALALQDLADLKYRTKNVDLLRMESLLLLWIEDQTESQVILSSPMIRRKAVEIYDYLSKFRLDDRVKFEASVDWYDKFKARHNLINKVTGHAAFDVYHQVANARLANLFIFDFKDFIKSEQYRPDQIFCVKETKLFWKKIPGTDFFKPSPDRMVLIFSSNMTATIRCKPAVIFSMGQLNFNQLHSNDCECCDLPVNWYAKRTTWMNSAMFQEWFIKLFVPEVKSYCERLGIPFKILLLLDKAPSHLDLPEVPNVNVMYLPSNTDSITNPMNHGIISEFQIGYLKKMLQSILKVVDIRFHKSRTEVWNSFGKKDTIDLISKTWNEISETTMKEAWAYVSGREEDIQARELKMADGIESCLQLLEKLMGKSVDKDDILTFLKSHNQEVSKEELADLCNIPTVLIDLNDFMNEKDCDGRKKAKKKPVSVKSEESRCSDENHLLHFTDKKAKLNSESNDSIDPTSMCEVEPSSSEMFDVDIEGPQYDLDNAITGSIKLDRFNNFNIEPDDLKVTDLEKSKKSIKDEGTMENLKDEGCECKYQPNASDEESKESLSQCCKSEPLPDMMAISDEEHIESRTIVTKRIRLSGMNDTELELEDLEQAKKEISDGAFKNSMEDDENMFKKEIEVDLEYNVETEVDTGCKNYAVEESINSDLKIAQLQKLIGLSYRLIAKSRENDNNPARRDQFISDVENAMQPYRRLLDLKLGGDELW